MVPRGRRATDPAAAAAAVAVVVVVEAAGGDTAVVDVGGGIVVLLAAAAAAASAAAAYLASAYLAPLPGWPQNPLALQPISICLQSKRWSGTCEVRSYVICAVVVNAVSRGQYES